MGHDKIIYDIVEQMKLIMKDYGLYYRDYKFLRLSNGNIKVLNKEVCKGCILYIMDFCKDDIINEKDSWCKHKYFVAIKLKKKHYDAYFECNNINNKYLRGTIGPFYDDDHLSCYHPITIKNKLTGDDLIIPEDILIKRILVKKNTCHDDLTRGTGIVFGLSKNDKPKLIDNFDSLHEDPGILSDELNKHFEGSDKVFVINVDKLGYAENSTLIKQQYFVAKCSLGKEISKGSIDICIECEQIRN